jgi:hypothetical protein
VPRRRLELVLEPERVRTRTVGFARSIGLSRPSGASASVP